MLIRKINPIAGRAKERVTFFDALGSYASGPFTVGKTFTNYSISYKHSGSNATIPANYYHLIDRDVKTIAPSTPQSKYNITDPLNNDFLKHYFGIHKSRPGISKKDISSVGDISFLTGTKKTVLNTFFASSNSFILLSLFSFPMIHNSLFPMFLALDSDPCLKRIPVLGILYSFTAQLFPKN